MAAPPNVAQQQLPRRGWRVPWVKFAAIGSFILVISGLVIFANWAWNNSKREAPQQLPAQNKNTPFTPVTRATAMPVVKEAKPPPMPVYDFKPQDLAPGKATATAASPVRNSTLFAYAAHTSAAEGAEAPNAHPVAAEREEQEAAADDALSASLKPSKTGKTAKGHILKNARFVIPRGTHIPCTLRDRIITQLPGFVTCETSQVVMGKHGDVMLLPALTRFFGQYSQGVNQGNDRLGVLWTNASTPDDVELPINSPAVDELGSAGVTGYIDNHVGSKIGALLLYTLLEAGPQIAQSALQNNNHGGNSYNTTTIAGPSQNVLGGWLQKQLQQPPTLIKNQGETIDIITAQDWDLSCCIKLELR